MTFVDTSAIYALLDSSDLNHQRPEAFWFGLLDAKAGMFTRDYLVAECCALARSRLGMEAVRVIQDRILTVPLAAARRKLSLVD